MFGASYSRTKFWVITLLIFVVLFPVAFMQAYGQPDLGVDILGLIISLFWMNALANRIRDYGSNPWLALLSLIPLVGLFQILYYGIRHKKTEAPLNNQGSEQYTQSTSQNTREEPELKRYIYKEEPAKEQATNTSYSEPKPSKPLKRLN